MELLYWIHQFYEIRESKETKRKKKKVTFSGKRTVCIRVEYAREKSNQKNTKRRYFDQRPRRKKKLTEKSRIIWDRSYSKYAFNFILHNMQKRIREQRFLFRFQHTKKKRHHVHHNPTEHPPSPTLGHTKGRKVSFLIIRK